jgi:hypothetical protein
MSVADEQERLQNLTTPKNGQNTPEPAKPPADVPDGPDKPTGRMPIGFRPKDW